MAGTNLINDYVAGAIGGCAGMAVGHPLDTVKVQMQTQSPHNPYNGMWDCIKSISQQKIRHGFFRGMSFPLVSFGFLNSTFFGMYGHILQMLGHNDRDTAEPHFMHTFAAGFLATLPTVFMATPIDVIKVTLQSQIEHEICPETGKKVKVRFYNGPFDAIKDILQKGGIRGIFRGFWVQLARDSPANAVYMSFYEVVAYEASQVVPSVPSPLVNFVSGGLAGVVSWLVIMPLDVIKSRMQADTRQKYYTGFWDCAKKAYSQEGYRVFYRGTLAVALRAFPVNAVTLMVYTEVLIYMNSNGETDSD
ncbi:solute carrier family 25 member 45-like [Littorina saxatilis]|uniref:Uncharacterized protein n=1 Tax=Littorina saxatilis TaxID=31220 RepID=A0AAN9GET2_9CAEN